jgi:hypothetical protein
VNSKQDKVKHPFEEVMTIPTQGSEMRQAGNNRQGYTGTSFSNEKASLFYINAQLSTHIK